jgi:hypothetical protein
MSTETLLDKGDPSTITPHEIPEKSLGVPKQKPSIPSKDVVTLAISLACFVLAVASVMAPRLAVFLGQTNQLIVVGFLLAIMALCSEGQMRQLSFLAEAQWGRSTLQNFEALLVSDAWARHISPMPRILLLCLFALPLGLSASYKNFVGGFTGLTIKSQDWTFGLTAAPGKQHIGGGLSLLVDAYLPFWVDPTFPGTYGFNMFVSSPTIVAMLDGPLPDHVSQLQSTLAIDNSVLLTATVDATVAEVLPLTPEERSNSSWWNDTYAQYGHGSDAGGLEALQYTADLLFGGYTGMLAEQGSGNYSQIFTGLWNTTLNESFESTAQRYTLTRRPCVGVWNITSSSVTLKNAAITEDAATALTSTNQSLVQNNYLGIQAFFGPFLEEYDWHNWVNFAQEPRLPRNASMGPGLVAAIVWARQVTFSGPERHNPGDIWNSLNQYERNSADVLTQMEARTLRRSGALIFVLAIQPFLTILTILGKWLLYSVPIGQDFGLISILGGICQSDLEMLKGSAFSGKLSSPVKIRFLVNDHFTGHKQSHIELRLNQEGANGKVRKWVKYG